MIDWSKAPDFYSPWGSDSETAMRLRWVANHPDATDEDLLAVLDGLVVPDDVYEAAANRLGI